MSCDQGQDLVALSSAAAIAIAEGKTADQVGLIGAIFTLIGDALALMSEKQSICENNTNH